MPMMTPAAKHSHFAVRTVLPNCRSIQGLVALAAYKLKFRRASFGKIESSRWMEIITMVPQEVEYASGDGTRIAATFLPADNARGTVVLAHGISVDRHEDGAFVELAEALADAKFSSLRFDYRGHGASGGAQDEITIAGETLDLIASVNYARSRQEPFIGIVAASFGAASVCCALERYAELGNCLVLWNPVLDLVRTFLKPELPWAAESFNDAGFTHLQEHGFLLLDGAFKLGRSLIDEMNQVSPADCLRQVHVPVLTLHGDADTLVSHDIARENAVVNSESEFVSIVGSEHGFGDQVHRNRVIELTVAWLEKHGLSQPG